MDRTVMVLGLVLVIAVLSAKAGASADASKRLTELMKNYDSRIRPYSDSNPVEVKLQISILDLGPINEKEFTFRTDMYLRHWWKDPRLELGVGNVTFNGDPSFLWLPDTFIKNSHLVQMHSSTTKTIRTILSSDGSIFMSARISAICTCNMDLHAYPMDNQTCGMILESYAFSNKDLSLKWHEKPVEYVKGDIQVEGYSVTDIESSDEMVDYIIGDSFSNLIVSFKIDRTFSYYVYRSYVPSTFLVIMTWGSFWLPMTTHPARVGLIVTNFLASAFILQGASRNITKVPYTTAMEIYLLVNIMFILATMLEYIAVLQMSARGKWCKMLFCRKQKSDNKGTELLPRNNHRSLKALKSISSTDVHVIDRISRFGFPLCYLLFLIVYFIFFINFAKTHNA